MKNIGIITSGGDSPGMNAAIRSIVKTAYYYRINCFGILFGFKGLINGNIINLCTIDVKNIINRGGTILKTARSKEFETKEGRKKAYKNFKKKKLDGLIIIGGNGTLTGAKIFEEEYNIPIIGIPGTIDNDIYGSDCTIGYDTALNTVIVAIDKIRDTATSHNRLFFIEVMGRESGFIALNSGIATGALNIMLPEKNYNINNLFKSIDKGNKEGKSSSIIIVSEDKKIQKAYSLAKITKKKYPNYEIRVSILGHIQRGGNPTCFDRVLASKLGFFSVKSLIDGKYGFIVGSKENKISYTLLKEFNKKKNKIDEELIKISKILFF
ncbi:6-phosphofructokinase [Candidatus Shikimatogenerans silvanidophilus]|uniref:6-phosphofructokinase n=1 Tax=Candidatus Shikimatogenerans silvanidophilus TaxID=2782547 RepID=UPI001BAABAE5|nr:6-phosphofructokinase [Candidatus Shikimatogenerans silvanidophilus]